MLDGDSAGTARSKRRKVVKVPAATAEATHVKILEGFKGAEAQDGSEPISSDELEQNVIVNVVNRKRGRPGKPKTTAAKTKRGRPMVVRERSPNTAQELVQMSPIQQPPVQARVDDPVVKASKPNLPKMKTGLNVGKELNGEYIIEAASPRVRRKAEPLLEPGPVDMEAEASTKPARRARKVQKPVPEGLDDTVDAKSQSDIKARRRNLKLVSVLPEPRASRMALSAVTMAATASVVMEEIKAEIVDAELAPAVPLPRRRGRPAKATLKPGKQAEVLAQDDEAGEPDTQENAKTEAKIELGRTKTKPSSSTPTDTASMRLEAVASQFFEQDRDVPKETKPRRGRPKKPTIAGMSTHEDDVEDKIRNTKQAEEEVGILEEIQPKRRGRAKKAIIAEKPNHEDDVQDIISKTQKVEQEVEQKVEQEVEQKTDTPAIIQPKRRGRPPKAESSEKPAKPTKKQSQSRQKHEPAPQATEVIEYAAAIEEVHTTPEDIAGVLSKTQRTKRGRPAKVQVHIEAEPETAGITRDLDPKGARVPEDVSLSTPALTSELPPDQPAAESRHGRPTKDHSLQPTAGFDPSAASVPTMTETEPAQKPPRPQPLTTQSSNISLSPPKADEEMRKAEGTKRGKGKGTLPVFRMTATRSRGRGPGLAPNEWMKEDWFEPSVPASLLR